ncbi:MAG: alpha/beta hydrolase [Phycisphaerales bacterium]
MRIIAFIVGVCVAWGSAFGQSDGVLVERFDKAYAAADFAAAVRAAEAIAERHPESGAWAFNAACANARVGELDKAKAWITAAADRGFDGVRSFETDEDLDPIRDSAEFAAAFAKVRAAADARLEGFKALAAGREPMVWVPAGADADHKVPAVIALHGTGGDARGMMDVWREACERAGCALIAIDAVRPGPGGRGYAWTYRDESAWLILKTLDEAVAAYPIDAGRVVLAGFSQGANVAMPFGVGHADRFRAVVACAGHYEAQIVDLEEAEGGERETPRYYFLIGARDEWAGTFRKALAEFRAAGVEAELEVVPGMGHAMPTGEAGAKRLERALRWCLAE